MQKLETASDKSIVIYLLMLPVIFGIILSLWKFQIAHENGFEIDTSNRSASYGVMDDGFVVLYPDELTYISWIDQRGGSFARFFRGEGDLSLNIFGYVVSATYYIFDEMWEYTFIIGILGYLMFAYSASLLLRALNVRSDVSFVLLVVVCFSPTVLNLTSGVLRDLYVISVMNYSIVALLRRSYVRFILAVFVMMSLRTYMPVIILPLYSYFFFFNRSRSILLVSMTSLAFLISLIAISIALQIQGNFYNTSLHDVFFRLISGLFGVNIVLLNLHELFAVPGIEIIEKLAALYQFLVMLLLYFLVMKFRFRVHSFFIPFLFVTISLSILYGFYLGYFVARTKFLILWLAVIFIGLQINKFRLKPISTALN